MTVGELRAMLEGLDDAIPVVMQSHDEDGPYGEYEAACAEVTTAIRLARRKRDRYDTWLLDRPHNMEGRAGQPRTRESVLLVQP